MTTAATTCEPLHVSVIGAGIGGACLTVGLLRAGVSVTVFESASKFSEIGAGISFGINAVHALQSLGLGSAFEQLATTVPSGQYFQWRTGQDDEQTLLAETYEKVNGNATVHRARFLDEIVKGIPDDNVRFGKRFSKVEKVGRKWRVHFMDGTWVDTDVVIGADGIHSAVRKAMLEVKRNDKTEDDKNMTTGKTVANKDCHDGTINDGDGASCDGKDNRDGEKPNSDGAIIEPSLIWSGTWAYRGLIPTEKFLSALGEDKGKLYGLTPQMFLGKDGHVLTFPIDFGKTINVVAFVSDRSNWPERTKLPADTPWTQETTQSAMLHDFSSKGWGQDILRILKCFPTPPSKWALHSLSPSMKSYQHDGIVLLGDAAHGGCPHHGAMAGQAIEDGLFLSKLLSHPGVTVENVNRALQVVDIIRLPRANAVMESSLSLGDKYELMSEELGDDINKVAQWLRHAWDWIWEYDLEKEWDMAKEELTKLGI
ncbi:unnamed protein product [Sympodiomycopsis kandeliae]